MREALEGTGAVVIDAHAALDMPEEAFFDAYHLKRDKVQKLTRFVGERMSTLTARPDGSSRPAPAWAAASAERPQASPGSSRPGRRRDVALDLRPC